VIDFDQTRYDASPLNAVETFQFFKSAHFSAAELCRLVEGMDFWSKMLLPSSSKTYDQ
jgi:hypothetical protein